MRKITDRHPMFVKTKAAFAGAKYRCQKVGSQMYPQYGARGIKFLFNKLQDLIDHIGYPESKDMTLDRIDNNGNYEPGNVRWASMKIQTNNRSNNRIFEFFGETKTASQWAEIYGINVNIVYNRIDRRGWDDYRAFSEPVIKKKHRDHILNGEKICLKSECDSRGLTYSVILDRINYKSWPIEKALSTPTKRKRRKTDGMDSNCSTNNFSNTLDNQDSAGNN